MRRGEEWALPAKDKGPVKALARDYVDSKRRFSEFYMYGLFLLVILLFFSSHNPVVSSDLPLVLLLMVVVMLIEGFFLGRKLKALAAERYPGESTRGLRIYAAIRGLQIRKLRFPKPRVKVGDTI